MLTLSQAANKCNLTAGRISQLIKAGRVSPAPVRFGYAWQFQDDFTILPLAVRRKPGPKPKGE